MSHLHSPALAPGASVHAGASVAMNCEAVVKQAHI